MLGPDQCGKTTLRRAFVNEQLKDSLMPVVLKSVLGKREIEDEEVGVQDDGYPALSVDKPGRWWI